MHAGPPAGRLVGGVDHWRHPPSDIWSYRRAGHSFCFHRCRLTLGSWGCRATGAAMTSYILRPGDDMPDDVARELRRHYRAAVSFTDANIGTVLDALSASPAANSTVVAIWGDHGWQLGEHGAWCKQTMWEIATRGVLMIKHPLVVPTSPTTDVLVEFLDILPTLADLAGLAVPAPCPRHNASAVAACTDGMSLRSLWGTPSVPVKPRALSLYPRPNMDQKQAMGYSMVTRVSEKGSHTYTAHTHPYTRTHTHSLPV